MSKQKKIVMSSLMVVLLLVGTLGMTMLAMAVETRATSNAQITTSSNMVRGSYKTKTSTGKILIFGSNYSSSTGVLRLDIEKTGGVLTDEPQTVVAIGATYGDTYTQNSFVSGSYRIRLTGNYKANGTGYISFS